MKKLDKIILTLFSVLIFLESALIICIITKLIDINLVGKVLASIFAKSETSKIILGLSVVCFLGSIKCIFFDGEEKEIKTKGVLMQNDNGKLLISKSTIENIVISSIKDFNSIENIDVTTELDANNALTVNVNLIVNKNVIIKELTVNIQNKIKDAIKRTSDLDVKEVNVRIKDISNSIDIKK